MSTVNFTVIQSPFTSASPYPPEPQDFAVAVLKELNNRNPVCVPLDQFRDPYTVETQVRNATYSDKHVRDLKASIKEVGLEQGIIGEVVTDGCGNAQAVIVEGNHRFKAMTELFDEGCIERTASGGPEIKAYILEEGFFPSDAYREAFQIYMNKPILKKSCSPDEVIEATGRLIEDGLFGDAATAPEGVIETAAKTFVRELYPTMSRKQVSDAVVARANKSRNNRRLTNGFTASDARDFKASSRTVFDGKDRNDYIISPMVISNDNADFRKALGEVIECRAGLIASGGAGNLAVRARLVAKTNKSTDADIDTYRAKIRAKVSAVNAYSQAEMSYDVIDDTLFLPEKTNESKERRLKRFV
jgi:hypothetical protein